MTIWKGFYPFEEQKELDKQPVAAPVGVSESKLEFADRAKWFGTPHSTFTDADRWPAAPTPAVGLDKHTPPADTKGALVDKLRALKGQWIGDGVHENINRDELIAAVATPAEVIGLDKKEEKVYNIRLNARDLGIIRHALGYCQNHSGVKTQEVLDKLNNL